MRNPALTRSLMALALLALAGCGGSSTPNSATTTSGGAPNAATSEPSAPPVEPTPPPQPIVVATGTVIPVTIDQTVSTKTNGVGDPFEASVAAPVLVDGKVAIPRGAKASGHVTAADDAGRLKGGGVLSVRLDSVTVGGEKMQVRTSGVTETSKGRGKRTAVGAGGGAAVGAIIGALAGGGKGAAIGAGAGAGAGTAGAAFTGERDITIPAETRLNFRLTAPLEITGRNETRLAR